MDIKSRLETFNLLHPQTIWDYLVLGGFALVFGLILSFIVSAVLRGFEKRLESIKPGEVRHKFNLPIFVLVIVLAVLLPLIYSETSHKLINILKHVLIIGLVFNITWMIVQALKIAFQVLLSRYDIEHEDNLEARKVHTQFRIIERIIIFVLVIIAVAIALMTIDSIRRIGVSLFASAGVASIIIGFSAQKMIGSVLAGFQIAITQPIRIDDVLIVENEWGWVEEITLTYVVVRIWDQRRLIVPTSYFIEKPFQNWTRVSAELMGTVFIYTDYSVPLEEIRKETTRLLGTTDLWDKKVNVIQVTDATEKTMEVRLLVSSTDSGKLWDLRVFLREKVIEFLQNNYPQHLPKSRVEIDKMVSK